MNDEFPEMPNLPAMIEQKESIKIGKNSKGYTWEIRILSTDIERMADLDNQMRLKFGDQS